MTAAKDPTARTAAHTPSPNREMTFAASAMRRDGMPNMLA